MCSWYARRVRNLENNNFIYLIEKKNTIGLQDIIIHV